MTRADIIDLGHKAGWLFVTQVGVASATTEWLEQFAALVAAAEREECAKVAEGYGPNRPVVSKNPSSQIIGRWEGDNAASGGIAAAIRARGQA